MNKMVIDLIGVLGRILLRCWTGDEKGWTNNLLDIEAFAQKCGLDIIESRKFKVSIERFAIVMSEDFIKEVSEIEVELERGDEILNQIKIDIEKVSLSEVKILNENLNVEKLTKKIMMQSEGERRIWSEKENGVYTNCIRHVSKEIIEFVKKWPSYTPEALNVIIQRQDEYLKILHKMLEEYHVICDVLKSVDTIYREYETVYREEIISRYGNVELLGIGLGNRAIRKYSISSAYVELECVEDDCEREIKLSQVFSKKKIVWIKGEAGSGKTTFLQWVAICSAKNEYTKIESIRNTIPIVISLRSADWPLNLQGTINKFSKNLGYTCPNGWLSNALKNNRVIVLIDGLDEIEESKREEAYDFIEEIVGRYPDLRVLITARNSVNDNLNCEVLHCEIQPMKVINIKRFVIYWHRSVLRTDAVEEDMKIVSLQKELIRKIIETPSMKSLARNPLLCAMICALNYANNEYLPENRMELYSKCCEMLVDGRDSQRKIKASECMELVKLDYRKKYRILEALAYWMLKNEGAEGNKIDAIKFIHNLLNDINIISLGAECDAEMVLEYLIERSGIIREDEENHIEFIHKTFMEFMAAKAICRECDFDNLVKEACNANWKETILMCFNEMNERQVKKTLERMVEKGKEKKDDRYIFMASLGAANTIYKNLGIKEEIDIQINKLIPPSRQNISVLAEAGSYLVPFLFDRQEYSNGERIRCLELLEHLELEKPIFNILSYLSGSGDEEVKMKSIDLLAVYNEDILEEYNVRMQLVEVLLNSIKDKGITVMEGMINIIGRHYFTKGEEEIASKVKRLKIICGVSSESLYVNQFDAFKYFENINELILEGSITNLYFMQYLTDVQELTINSNSDMSDIIEILSSMGRLKKVRRFKMTSEKLHYFCEKDLMKMENLKYLEFCCYDKNLVFDFEKLTDFLKLETLFIDVDKDILENLKRSGFFEKGMRKGIKVVW